MVKSGVNKWEWEKNLKNGISVNQWLMIGMDSVECSACIHAVSLYDYDCEWSLVALKFLL